MKRVMIIFSLFFSVFTQAGNQKDFLPVQQAFPYHQSVIGNELVVTFDTVPGYYLYQKRMSFKPVSSELILGEPVFSVVADQKLDPNFGKVNIFSQPLTVRIPFKGKGDAKVRFQGCSEDGLCYMPQTKLVELEGL